jgi:large subunit ribosomal protein L31
MQTNIHPKHYPQAVVTCACGNSFTTGSTLPEIKVDICSACHPFFTGKMKFVDTMGRVERFQAKMKAVKGKKYVKKSERKQKQEEKERPETLKEMIQQQQKAQKQ